MCPTCKSGNVVLKETTYLECPFVLEKWHCNSCEWNWENKNIESFTD